MKKIQIARPVQIVGFNRMSTVDQQGNPRYLVGLEQNLDEIHADLPKGTNNVVFSLRQLETLAQSNNMSVNAAFALLRLAGNSATITVEERIVGEDIVDDNGNPVLNADGTTRTYLGPIDGSLTDGDKYAVISIDYIDFGTPALAKHTDIILQAELAVQKDNMLGYAFPERRAANRRLGAAADGGSAKDPADNQGADPVFKFRPRKTGESKAAFDAELAKAKEEFEAAQAEN
jgi:hypothetical protein